MQVRIKAELWIKAHIRKCNALAISATVVRRGDDQAGALIIKVNQLGPGCAVLVPVNTLDGGRKWRWALGENLVPEAEADAYIEKQLNMDPDIWILEIEDREGRHLVDDISK